MKAAGYFAFGYVAPSKEEFRALTDGIKRRWNKPYKEQAKAIAMHANSFARLRNLKHHQPIRFVHLFTLICRTSPERVMLQPDKWRLICEDLGIL